MHVASTTLREPGWQCSTMALGRPGGQLQGPALCRSLLPITRNLVKAGRLKSAGWILLSFLWVSFVWGCMMIGAVFEGFTVYVYIYKYILAHIYYSAYIYITLRASSIMVFLTCILRCILFMLVSLKFMMRLEDGPSEIRGAQEILLFFVLGSCFGMANNKK